MKKFLLGAAALVLVGGGCGLPGKYYGEPDKAKNPDTAASSGLTLAVSAIGNKQVKVEFKVPETDAKGAEGYRILMGREANPTKENATDWYTLGPDHREKLWTSRPEGKRHFRVCVMKKDACAAYSNNVEVDIK